MAQGNSSKMAHLEDAGMSAGCLAGLPTGCAVNDMPCNNSWGLGGDLLPASLQSPTHSSLLTRLGVGDPMKYQMHLKWPFCPRVEGRQPLRTWAVEAREDLMQYTFYVQNVPALRCKKQSVQRSFPWSGSGNCGRPRKRT